MIKVQQCPICNGITFAPFITCIDHAVSHETFHLIKCADCELLITSPRPVIEDTGKYYESPAYISHSSKAKTSLDKMYVTARTFTLKWKMSVVEKHASLTTRKNLLDFGSGVGEFLKVAKSNGWNITGVEPSKHAREQAADIIAKDIKPALEDVTQGKNTFDVITAWHVMEHVHELSPTIHTLRNLLEEKGTLIIAVPNHHSWDAIHYKQYWAAYDVPRHLWHFNMKSMTRLLESHGLRITTILPMRLDAFYISLLSEKYRAGSFTIGGMTTSFLNGLRSNYHAKKNMEYSSLIYIVKR